MEVILVRHTSVDVAPGTCYGQSDVPVRDTFEEEAEMTRRRLMPYLPFDRVYSSPLTRARKLAAYCGYPQPIVDNRLMEMSMGEWEMQRYEEIRDVRLNDWYNDYMHLPTPGGESFPMLYQRVREFLEELRGGRILETPSGNKRQSRAANPPERVAVFAHGGVLIAAGLYAGLFEEAHAWDHLVEFGGIERIEI